MANTKEQNGQTKDIGFGIVGKSSSTPDKHDPFTSGFGVRGTTLTGKVTGTKSAKTATITITRKIKVPKYNRFLSRTYKIHAHNPESIDAKVGDEVKIIETRPISKTKHFCIVQIMKRDQE